MSKFIVMAVVKGHNHEVIHMEAEDAPSALRHIRLNRSDVFSVENVYLNDGKPTEVCHLHTAPVPCERCEALSNGTFSADEIRLDG